ncbi:MAG: efflux RND transporter periplasmic adaptor subunit [Steroidobacteraceae bacterium]
MAFDQEALDSLRRERKPAAPAPESQPLRKWIVIAVIAVIAIAAAAFLLRGNAIPVETARATAASGSGPAAVLNASGYVVARRQATVSSKVTGRVDEVLIEEGMAVEKGALLARLDASTVRPVYELAQRQLDAARKNLAEVQVRLDEAQRTLRRNEQLRAQKLVSESQLDAARAEALALAARLEALKSEVSVAESNVGVRAQDLQDLEVVAPFDGVVVSKDAQPGEVVSPISAGGGFTRTGIATIVDMTSREIEVDVNEAFINRVRANQKTEAVLDAYPDWSIPSHVINIVPTADRQKATVRVRIGFDGLDPRILPDMGIKVRFLEEGTAAQRSSAVVRIPASSVVSEADTRYVWRVRDDTVERVAIRTGSEREGQIDVLSGLNAGDLVVTRPVEGLKDGAKIKQTVDG